MNKDRRRKISMASEFLHDAYGIIETAMNEEQDAMDNMPENFQESDRYSEMEDIVYDLEDALSDLDSVIEIVDKYHS